MATFSLLRNLLDGIGKETAPRPSIRRPSAVSSEIAPPPDLEAKLHDALSSHGSQVNCRVFLVELDTLRDQFGEKWDRMFDKVHIIARESIERHLAGVDVYTQYNETSYVVVYAELNPHEAKLKCLLIAREMARRLIGSETASDQIIVKTAVTRDDGEIVFEEVGTFDSVAQDFKTADTGGPSRQLLAVPDLTHGWGDYWNELQFIYRPLLALRGMVVSTYMCIPVRPAVGNKFNSGYQVLHDSFDANQIADLDLFTLAVVATDAAEMATSGAVALLSVPVHFETLANSHNRKRFLGYCRKWLEAHAGHLIFELVGLPEGVPQSRLVDLVSMLKPHARAVIARFPLARGVFGSYRVAGLHAVGVDIYYSQEREATMMRQMEKFVAAANKEFLRTFIHGVRTISLNTAAITAGFDYVDGYALSSVANVPKHAERYELSSLYRPLLGNS